MIHLFSKAIAYIRSFLKMFQVQQVMAIALVGVLFLLAPAETPRNNPDLGQRIDRVLEKTDSDRPTTTREWEQEARDVEGKPGERLKRIGVESKEALKDWSHLYPDTAERTADTLKEESGLGRDR
jgi:hypothetical protein